MRRFIVSGVMACLMIVLGAEGRGQDGIEEPLTRSNAEPSASGVAPAAALARASQDFACRLLRALAERNTKQNILISPACIQDALYLAWAGAAGDTRREMANALGWGAMEAAAVSEGMAALRQTLRPDGVGMTLDIANGLWIDSGISLNPVYAAQLREEGADVISLPFDDALPEAVNLWVKEKTRGRLALRVGPTEPGACCIVSALYFQGAWRQPFKPEATQTAPFTAADGSLRTVSMMVQSGMACDMLSREQFQAIRLPLGAPGEGAASMIIILPSESLGINGWLSRLTPEFWATDLTGWNSVQCATVSLPRFSLSDENPLHEFLPALGMPAAFGAEADFSGISQAPLHLGTVRAEANLHVDEAGAVAAAVTAIGLNGESAEPEPEFLANRPFVVAVTDDATGAILCMGAFREPMSGLLSDAKWDK